MNNIANQYSLAGLTPRFNTSPDFRSAGYAKEQSVKAHESLDTGLVITTREGDQVTLSSNSFYEMDAFMYDSKGVVQTDAGLAAFSVSEREISLTSGQSFSFSVEGDLSEAELKDIEAILKGLDEVISEMTQGDMFGAVDKALLMGNYDTVSSFSADISYQQSYETRSAVAATATGALSQDDVSGEHKLQSSLASDESREYRRPRANKNGAFPDFDTFFKKMADRLASHEEKQLGLAKDPVNKLFKHHLDEIEDVDGKHGSIYRTLEKAMGEIDSLLERMMENAFGDQ